MVQAIDRGEERRTTTFLPLQSTDLSFDGVRSQSQKTRLDERRRSKAPDSVNSQPEKTLLREEWNAKTI
jgi:hypothetical protein